MRSIAVKDDPELWEYVKEEGMEKFGKWSARLAQWAVRRYKELGGGYIGRKDPENSLTRWSNERWTTKSGLPSSVTGERYLPEEVIDYLSDEEYRSTSRKKKSDSRRGIQWSRQPDRVARKVSGYRRKYLD